MCNKRVFITYPDELGQLSKVMIETKESWKGEKTMKKLLLLLAISMFAVSMAFGCGDDDDTGADASTDADTDTDTDADADGGPDGSM
jgi:hypothetical protein